MNLYAIALFIHILCAMGIVAGVVVMFLAAAQLRRAANVGEAQRWLFIAQRANISLGTLAALLLIPAFFMVTVAWDWKDRWIDVAGVGFLIVALLCIVPLRSAYTRLEDRLAHAEGAEVLAPFQRDFASLGLWVPLGMVAGALVGLLYLMTNKPDLAVSAIAVGAGVLVGPLVTAVWQRPSRVA